VPRRLRMPVWHGCTCAMSFWAVLNGRCRHVFVVFWRQFQLPRWLVHVQRLVPTWVFLSRGLFMARALPPWLVHQHHESVHVPTLSCGTVWGLDGDEHIKLCRPLC
jgi:hypothetical protein